MNRRQLLLRSAAITVAAAPFAAVRRSVASPAAGEKTLAEHVTMSPRNFARIFRREMGTTPGKFVERLRIETARRRLEETPRSLKRIAQECGFGSVGSMRAVFQRVVGISPGQYRQHFRSS
jgi:transcriptional regulator GlxA family with amidase domain